MKLYVIRIFYLFPLYSRILKRKRRKTTRIQTRLFWVHQTSKDSNKSKFACIFVNDALRLYTNAPSTVQTSCKISLAAPISVCSHLGQENRENASNLHR